MDLLKKINSRLGQVVLMSQSMEFNISFMLSIDDTVTKLKEPQEKDGGELIYDSIEAFSKKTYGILLKKLSNFITLNDEEENILSASLKERNYLIHNLTKDNLHNFSNKKGRIIILKKVNKSYKDIEQGYILLHRLVDDLMIAVGADTTQLKQLAINKVDIKT